MKKKRCGSSPPVQVGKKLHCTRKTGHFGDCQAPIGGGDTTFWPRPKMEELPTDAPRMAKALTAWQDAFAGIANPVAVPELVKAALDARDHMQELREAWERGIITEHDGHGGRRSNRNVDVLVRIRAAITALDKKGE